jgi:hypothetical protein
MPPSVDILGQKFGFLTAINKTEERRHGCIVWEFLCDCGKVTFVPAKSVKCGNTRSCGCENGRTASTKEEKKCLNCGDVFLVKKSHYRRSKHCSKTCYAITLKTTGKGKANPNWKGGISFSDDYLKERAKIWRDKNPEKISQYNRNGKVKRKGAEGSHTKKDIATAYKSQAGRCAYCKKKVGSSYHVDHILPIAKGGSNFKENICISCPTCNLKKRDKCPFDWANERGLLL